MASTAVCCATHETTPLISTSVSAASHSTSLELSHQPRRCRVSRSRLRIKSAKRCGCFHGIPKRPAERSAERRARCQLRCPHVESKQGRRIYHGQTKQAANRRRRLATCPNGPKEARGLTETGRTRVRWRAESSGAAEQAL